MVVDHIVARLRLARRAATDAGATTITWMRGSDRDVDTLLDGAPPLDGVVIAQALHWMDPPRLFATLRPLVRPRRWHRRGGRRHAALAAGQHLVAAGP